MPDLRTDWLTGRTVIVAENRALRPNEFTTSIDGEAASVGLSLSKSAAGQISVATTCPFCPGNEARTPPAEYEQLDEQGRWRVRAIPNKFPALTLNAVATGDRPGVPPAVGAHEVIIESARHIDRTSALSTIDLRHVLEAYAERLKHWRDDGRFAYGLVFKNQGPRAGASIAHLHSQLIALPAIPPAIEAELQRAEDAFVRQRSCAYCRLLEDERTLRSRIVFDRDGYVAFCPFTSVQSFEVWLLPANHEPSFEQAASRDALNRLAGVLHTLIASIESVIPVASYNLLLRTAPWKADCDRSYHWRIELLPRLNAIAGMEVATGIYINPVPPERAAKQLRPV